MDRQNKKHEDLVPANDSDFINADPQDCYCHNVICGYPYTFKWGWELYGLPNTITLYI